MKFSEMIVRGRPKLTLWSVTVAQLRALFVGSLLGWGIVAVIFASAVSGVIAGVSGLSSPSGIDPISGVNSALALAAVAVQLFAIVVGVEAIGGEFASGTITATFAACPRRGILFSAKTVAVCSLVMVLATIAGFLAGGSSLLVIVFEKRPVEAITFAAWALSVGGFALGAGVLALLALSLGALSRQRIVAVLVPIAALYILPLLAGLLPLGMGRNWANLMLPGNALSALSTASVHGASLLPGLTLPGGMRLTWWSALLVLGAWCAVTVPWSIVSFLRRDLSAASTWHPRARNHSAPRPQRHPRKYRSSLGGLLRSELRKTWSLPAVRWIIAFAILLEVAYGIVRAVWSSVEGVGATLSEGLSIEYSFAITGGVGGVALILAVLAAIQVAAEFETGTAASTFIASPQRHQVTVSKAITVALCGMLVALSALFLAAITTLPIYAARGYVLTSEVFVAGFLALVRALLFLVLTTLMSAGIAGVFRRSVPTLVIVSVLLVVGPALLNTVLGFARAAQSPLVVVGNAARFLPWEGANFLVPYGGDSSFIAIDGSGILHLSALAAILVTSLWVIAAVTAWIATDVFRPIPAP